jgi:hypothetical protein
MKIHDKRKAGEILGRSGIAERILNIMRNGAQRSYKDAIHAAGQISVLVQSCSYDMYWDEKARGGINYEQQRFECLISETCSTTREEMMTQYCTTEKT